MENSSQNIRRYADIFTVYAAIIRSVLLERRAERRAIAFASGVNESLPYESVHLRLLLCLYEFISTKKQKLYVVYFWSVHRLLLGPFHGAIAVLSVTRCRCRCRCRRGHRCAGGVRQYR